MALDDYLEPEVMIAVAVTAAVASPPVRRVVRRGLVYGLAGMLTVGDKLAAGARSVAQNAQQLAERATSHGPAAAEETTAPAASAAATS
jgi:hypothetical protein